MSDRFVYIHAFTFARCRGTSKIYVSVTVCDDGVSDLYFGMSALPHAEQSWHDAFDTKIKWAQQRNVGLFTLSQFRSSISGLTMPAATSTHSSYHLLKLKLNVSRFIIYVIIHFNYVMLFWCVRTTVCFSEQLKALRALRANVQSDNDNDDEESVWQFVECIKENS